MKKYLLLWICVVGLWAASFCQIQYITQEQAEDAVRSFESNSALQFGSVMYMEDTSGPEWLHDACYELEHSDYSNIARSWSVDAVSGEVTAAFYGDKIPDNPVDSPYGTLTQEQCRVIATNFAQAKCADFNNMGLQLDTQEWNFTGWHFDWAQYVAYGAITPNGVDICVNPSDGSIQSYIVSRFPPSNPRQPQLSAEDAVNVAMLASGMYTLEDGAEPNLYTNPDGEVIWTLCLAGTEAEGITYSILSVTIDAETGNILEMVPSDEAPSTTAINTIVLVPIREMIHKINNSAVYWLGNHKGKLILDRQAYMRTRQAFLLRPGSDQIEFGDKKIKLTRKVELKNGKLMVPANLLDILKRVSETPPKLNLRKIQLPTPKFDKNPGTIKADQKITISCAVKKATLRYTTDGNDPTESSAVYNDPVAISQSCTLKAKAFKSGWTASALKSAAYTIE